MSSDDNTRGADRPFSMAQPTVPALILYLCGCKGGRAGGKWRGWLPMRCPKCQRELKGTT